MASKEVMIVTPEDINHHLVIDASMADTLRWLIANAGIDMDDGAIADFVEARALRDGAIRNLWELRAWCKKAIECIETVTQHAYNVGSEEDLPSNVKWSKQSYTMKWKAEGSSVNVVRSLSKKGLLTVDQALCELSVDAVVRASGIDKNKLVSMFPDDICEEPKKRTLSIK